ncbi:hypothetical protein ACFWTE_11550 [Nocardiopsis sp. NPDC058631]|uniref:hypothetical protein n=1 Tax=Nocardiopsis sp. NPDC058631 TaxID=3346566 RepID=UPI00364CABF6
MLVNSNDYRSRRGDGEVDVLNGYRGVVTAVDANRGARIAWRHGGRPQQAWISPKQLRRGDLDLGYATTIASAQGMTTDRCHVYGLGADARGLYPAMSRARERTDLYLPAAEIEPEITRARLGEAADEAQALARAVAAYAATLTDDEDQLLLDELAARLPEGTPDLPAPAAADHDDDQVVPEHERQAAQARALIRQATELESALPALREEYRLAEQRAEVGRLRLMMGRTNPAAARAAAHQAGERIHHVSGQADALRDRARKLSEQARAGRERQESAAVAAAQRAQHLTALEPVATSRALTRAELATLNTDGLTKLDHAAWRKGMAGRSAKRPPSRISAPPAPAPAPAPVRKTRTPRPTPPPSAPYRHTPGPIRGRGPGIGR